MANYQDVVIYTDKQGNSKTREFKGSNRTYKSIMYINKLLTKNKLEVLTYDYDEDHENEMKISSLFIIH
jgi:hypothetical protein